MQKIDRIVAPFRGRQGVKLLDYSNDEDHNRLVVTVVGEPERFATPCSRPSAWLCSLST